MPKAAQAAGAGGEEGEGVRGPRWECQPNKRRGVGGKRAPLAAHLA